MSEHEIKIFQETVWTYYVTHGRHDLPWRLPEVDGSFDPYKIFVSEVMLQQTQVQRVIPKFLAFIGTFPSFAALAKAPLSAVLKNWSGLGYNRRAKFLWQAAQHVMREHNGELPAVKEALIALPGVGPNTAGAILAYAHNMPTVFIETNIRTVFIHHFFVDREKVSDKDIATLVQQTLPEDDVRNWYWALMDYGTHVKQAAGNASRRSAGYAKQSSFEGSRRQVRGRVLRLLAENSRTEAQLVKEITDERLMRVLADLQGEGFIEEKAAVFTLRTT